MRAAAFETISPNGPITALPLTLVQTASRSSPLLMLVLALPATVAALTPFLLIAHHAAQDATLLMDRQDTSLRLVLALAIWAGLFGWPITHRALRIGQRRQISISANKVTVSDAGLMTNETWSEPLHTYRGLAHHVRSSLSGTRQELILIHSDPARSLLLRTADRIGQPEIDQLTQLLGCREIAPQVFYRNTVRATGTTHPTTGGQLATAA